MNDKRLNNIPPPVEDADAVNKYMWIPHPMKLRDTLIRLRRS